MKSVKVQEKGHGGRYQKQAWATVTFNYKISAGDKIQRLSQRKGEGGTEDQGVQEKEGLPGK